MTRDEELIRQTIGATLRAHRRAANMGQMELAKWLEISRSAVGHYETGHLAIPEHLREPLKSILNMTDEDFNPALQRRVSAIDEFLGGVFRVMPDDQFEMIQKSVDKEVARRKREHEKNRMRGTHSTTDSDDDRERTEKSDLHDLSFEELDRIISELPDVNPDDLNR